MAGRLHNWVHFFVHSCPLASGNCSRHAKA